MSDKPLSENMLVLEALSKLSQNDTFKRISINTAILNADVSLNNIESIQHYLYNEGLIEVVDIGGVVSITQLGLSRLEKERSPPIYIEFLYKIIKLLKPKFHNSITMLLVLSGLGFFSSIPLVNQLINVYLEKEWNIEIINDNDPYFGLFLIVLALRFWLITERRRK